MRVYSKEKGFTSPPREAYTRRPGRTPRVSVPPNYRGHAIVDGEERPLGIWENVDPQAPADTPVPRFDDLPRVSRLGDGHRDRPSTYPSTHETDVEAHCGNTEGTPQGREHFREESHVAHPSDRKSTRLNSSHVT